MSASYHPSELARIVGGTLRGPPEVDEAVITGVADVAEAHSNEATWVSHSGYARKLPTSQAGVVLTPSDFGPTPMPAILCESLDRSVAELLAAFAPPVSHPAPGIHPTAVVHETARIGSGTGVGPYVVVDANAEVGCSCVLYAGVFIGSGTKVGNDCVIWPHAVIRDGCRVGNRVIIHPNAVIGADGFGFYFEEGRHNKVPHIGGVILEDDVEVGACTCIDRAKFGHTVIGRGTKIDNQVQIAHNVRVGEHCVFAGQSGISGSVRIGSHCIFGGRAAVLDNVTIGDGARFCGGLAVATKDIPAGLTVSGFPARDHREELRDRASLRRLPAMAAQLKELMARIERLETSTNHQS